MIWTPDTDFVTCRYCPRGKHWAEMALWDVEAFGISFKFGSEASSSTNLIVFNQQIEPQLERAASKRAKCKWVRNSSVSRHRRTQQKWSSINLLHYGAPVFLVSSAGSRGLLECKPGIMPLVVLTFHHRSIYRLDGNLLGSGTWTSYQRYALFGPNSSNRQYIRLILMTMLYDDVPTTSFTLSTPTVFFSSTHALLHCHA